MSDGRHLNQLSAALARRPLPPDSLTACLPVCLPCLCHTPCLFFSTPDTPCHTYTTLPPVSGVQRVHASQECDGRHCSVQHGGSQRARVLTEVLFVLLLIFASISGMLHAQCLTHCMHVTPHFATLTSTVGCCASACCHNALHGLGVCPPVPWWWRAMSCLFSHFFPPTQSVHVHHSCNQRQAPSDCAAGYTPCRFQKTHLYTRASSTTPLTP